MTRYEHLSREELIELLRERERLSTERDATRVVEEERYKNLVDQASDGIFIADTEGRYLDVNDSGARLLKMHREEVIGKRILDVVAEREWPRVEPELARLRRGETTCEEWQMRCADGTTFPAEVSAKLLSDGRVQGIVRNIAARKLTVHQLAERVERFRSLTASAFEGLCISDQGKIIEVNDQLARMLGYEHAELIGREVLSFVASDAQGLVASAIDSGREGPYEHRARRKDGTTFFAEVHAKSLEWEGRQVRVTAIRDVTERRRVEDAIQSMVKATASVGEEFFRSLVRELASALQVRYAFVGELCGERLELVRTIALWAGDEAGENFEFVLKGTASEKVVEQKPCFYPHGVRQLFPDDSQLKTLEIEGYFGVPLLDRKGRVLGLLVALHDRPLAESKLAKAVLTIFADRAATELERRRADAALVTSEECLRATLETTPHVAVQWYDLGGRVQLWNQASERMFGYSADEAMGKRLDQLILSPEAGIEFVRTLGEVERTRVPVGPVEYCFRRRDGSQGYSLSTLFRIPAPKQGSYVVCMDIDITDRKRAEAERAALEDQLRHGQKLDALGTLAGGVAHDFNNILSVFFGYVELITLDAEQPLLVKAHAAELLNAAIRARDLTQQILAFSRKERQERKPMALGPVLREALKFLRFALPASVQLSVRIDGAPVVLADAVQIHQVVMNLGMNAAHAMASSGGTLHVTLGAQDLVRADEGAKQVHRPGRYARLTVTDTGCGIDPETMKRIFEPFFTTKGPGEGTGLGLAVVQGIVRDHEGLVVVESTPMLGTAFSVFFPAYEWEQAEVEQAIHDFPRGRGEKILLVDDEQAVRESSRLLLQRMGYGVTSCADPVQALAAFLSANCDFDLVITDLTMPHMTGIELARQLLELSPGLPILLVSGYSREWTTEQVKALGVYDLITKPVRPAALATSVRATLDSAKHRY